MFSYFVIAIITPVGVYFEAQRSQLAMIIVFGGIFLFVALIYFLTKFIGFDLETIIDSLIENHLSITTLATVIFTFICNIISYHISLKLLNKKNIKKCSVQMNMSISFIINHKYLYLLHKHHTNHY